jgi:hypothetical protein
VSKNLKNGPSAVVSFNRLAKKAEFCAVFETINTSQWQNVRINIEIEKEKIGTFALETVFYFNFCLEVWYGQYDCCCHVMKKCLNAIYVSYAFL